MDYYSGEVEGRSKNRNFDVFRCCVNLSFRFAVYLHEMGRVVEVFAGCRSLDRLRTLEIRIEICQPEYSQQMSVNT